MSLLFFTFIAAIALLGFGISAVIILLLAKRNRPAYPEDQH